MVVPGPDVAGKPARPNPSRRVAVLIALHNPTGTVAKRQLALRIISREKVNADKEESVMIGSSMRIRSSQTGLTLASLGESQWSLRLPALTIAPGESRQVVWTIDRNDPQRRWGVDREQAKSRPRCGADNGGSMPIFRSRRSRFPTRISRPCSRRACATSGRPARSSRACRPSTSGPTVYRGLWVVDGSFLLEAAAILGRGHDARAGVEYLLGHQKPDGSFEILPHFWKENGIVLWAATRHAVLTQDQDWLRASWPRLQAVVQAIETLRAGLRPTPRPSSSACCPPARSTAGSATRPSPSTRTRTGAWPASRRPSPPRAGWAKTGDAKAWQKPSTTISWPLTARRPRATRATIPQAILMCRR